jgi:hypothetical protein
MNKYKTYIIEGKEFNAVELGKELSITQQTARNRLKTCKTIKELTTSARKFGGSSAKVYTIEGTNVSTIDVMKKLGCGQNTARNRIYKSKTLKELYMPIKTRIVKKEELKTPDQVELDYMNKLLSSKW